MFKSVIAGSIIAGGLLAGFGSAVAHADDDLGHGRIDAICASYSKAIAQGASEGDAIILAATDDYLAGGGLDKGGSTMTGSDNLARATVHNGTCNK